MVLCDCWACVKREDAMAMRTTDSEGRPIPTGVDQQAGRPEIFEPRAGGSSPPDVINLPRIQGERERGEAYRSSVRARLEGVCVELNAAQRDGLRVSFQVGVDGFGRWIVQSVDVVKPL